MSEKVILSFDSLLRDHIGEGAWSGVVGQKDKFVSVLHKAMSCRMFQLKNKTYLYSPLGRRGIRTQIVLLDSVIWRVM